MAIDLNRIRERLKRQRPVNVRTDGSITPNNPHNDGTREGRGGTTLEPKRFS